MKNRTAVILVVFWLASLNFIAVPRDLPADEVFITIGGGDLSGVYFPSGLAIAKMLNNKRQEYHIRATVEATAGATFNLNAILAGYLEFGLTQSDKQYEAVNGLAEWADKGPQTDLRAVFSLYHEAVTLVAAEDSGVRAIADLKGKRVSTGNPGSSQHRIVMDTLEASLIDPGRDITTLRVMASNAPTLLRDHIIDAFFFTVGHPSDTIRSALSGERRARIIPIEGAGIDRLIAAKPYYLEISIPVGRLYPEANDPRNVPTLGVTATLCTSARVPDQVVYALTKEVLDNLKAFIQQHPAFFGLSREGMLKGLTAPIHPGALKYFRETGLIE